jgi:hypothetical protein
LRQLLQQVELLRSGPELLRSGPDLRRPHLRRSRELRPDLRRSRRELLRCAVELLPPFELLPEPLPQRLRQRLRPQELLPPFELLQSEQGLLPEELLRSGSQLLRSGPELRRSDVRRPDLRRSLQLSESKTMGYGLDSRP